MNIHIENQYLGFHNSFILAAIRTVAKTPLTFNLKSEAQLKILGPFNQPTRLRTRVIERIFHAKNLIPLQRPSHRKQAVVLYVTEENTRHDGIAADFFIGPDLGVDLNNYFRMPNWWCCLDWSEYGIDHHPSPRVRRLIKPQQLLKPLGKDTLQRARRAALFASHMREPRPSIYRDLSSVVEIDGFGRAFDNTIENHNKSGFFKDEILKKYMFCICPENSLYPGYYTEKVPESFAAGCIPVSWMDQNVTCDFEKGSFINLADFAQDGYASGFAECLESDYFKELFKTPLLSRLPDVRAFLEFLTKIVSLALK